MNYKTIRAYQFKADEAVAALEAAGAVWTVGQGKPHWVIPSVTTVDVEAIHQAHREEFAKRVDKVMFEAMLELKEIPKAEQARDDFEIGPQSFPDRHRYIGRLAKLNRIPSWHGCTAALVGSNFTVDEIKFTTKANYKGYTVAGYLMGQKVWFPLSCVKFI